MEGTSEELLVTSACIVKGIGVLETEDFLVGSARGSEGGAVEGTWHHWGPPVEDADCPGHGYRHRGHSAHGRGHVRAQTGRRDSFMGHVDYLRCRINGATLADFSGTGWFNHEPDHTFRVVVQDVEPPARDYYRLIVLDPYGDLVFDAAGTVEPGDVSISLR